MNIFWKIFKLFCFNFSSVFAFKQTKEHILIQVQPLKMWNTKIWLLISGLLVNFSEALRPKTR